VAVDIMVAVGIQVEVGAMVGVEGLSVAVGVAMGTLFLSQPLTRASTALKNTVFIRGLNIDFS